MRAKEIQQPNVSGKSESRESKQKLIFFTTPKGNHFLDSFGYMCRHKTSMIIDECNEIDESIIKEILNNRKK